MSAPTVPNLVGLPLHKVGRTTRWTSATIVGTCLDHFQTNPCIHPGTTVKLCQYLFGEPHRDLASSGDRGSPVFRIVDPQCDYTELYGILWAGGDFIVPPAPWTGGSVGKVFAFSLIGGVSFQATGVQSPQDLGPLSFTTTGACTPVPTPATAPATKAPTPTPTPKPCGLKPDGCECRPAIPTGTRTARRTPSPTATRPPSPTPTRTPIPAFPTE